MGRPTCRNPNTRQKWLFPPVSFGALLSILIAFSFQTADNFFLESVNCRHGPLEGDEYAQIRYRKGDTGSVKTVRG